MNNQKHLLKDSEIIFMILIIYISKLILNVPASLVLKTGTGTIINLIFLSIIGYLLVLLILKLFTFFPCSNILDISKYLGGNLLYYFNTFLFYSLIIFSISITIIDFTHILQIIYFNNFNLLYIILFFLISCLICNLLGFKSIINTIKIILPFSIITILLSTFGMISDFNISNFTPIIGKNFYTTFIDGITNIFSLYIIFYLFLILPFFKNPNSFKKISILSYTFSVILLFITTIPILNLYENTNNSESINYLYLLSRNITFGNFINRVDAIFVLIWIFLTLIYISLSTYLCNRILGQTLKLESPKQLSYLTILFLSILSTIPLNISKFTFLTDTVYKYLVILFGITYPIIILILANIKKHYTLKKESK